MAVSFKARQQRARSENVQFVNRTRPTRNFTVVSNDILDDVSLSWDTKAVLLRLLSNHAEWVVTMTELMRQLNLGKTVAYRMFGEMRKACYVLTERVYENGKIAYYQHRFYDVPAICMRDKLNHKSEGMRTEGGEDCARNGYDPKTIDAVVEEAMRTSTADQNQSSGSPNYRKNKDKNLLPGNLQTGFLLPGFEGAYIEKQDLKTETKTKTKSPPPPPAARGRRVEQVSAPLDLADGRVPKTIPVGWEKPKAEILSVAAVEAARAAYNAAAKTAGLPVCASIRGERLVKLSNRLAEIGGLDVWQVGMAKIPASGWLTGRSRGNRAGWKADIDFCLFETKLRKLIEGSYDDVNMPFDAIERLADDPMIAKALSNRLAVASGYENSQDRARAPGGAANRTEAAPADPADVARDGVLRDKLLDVAGESVDRNHRLIKDDLKVPKSWIAKGCDLALDILPAISKKVRTRKPGAEPFFSWAIFTDDVMAGNAKRMEKRKISVDRYAALGFMDWGDDGKTPRWLPHNFDHRMWRSLMVETYDPHQGECHGQWFEPHGPAPGQPGCLVSPDLLELYGFPVPDGAWEAWKERLDEVKRIDQSYFDRSQELLEQRMAKIEALEKKGIKRRGLGSFAAPVNIRDAIRNGGPLIAPTPELEPESDPLAELTL
jgi:hypothetical protein